MTDTDWSEHYIKRGDPNKPTYYIIRRKSDYAGLFSNFTIFAVHIRYALSNGWLPVIDMQNYPNAYLAPEKLGKENSWEYFFEQPLRIGLEEAYNGENVLLSREYVLNVPWGSVGFYENRDGILTEWRTLIKLGLLKIKPALMEEILSVRQKLFAPNDRMLGVHLRGTDFMVAKPYNHPIPPPTEFALSIIIEKLREWKCNKLFLATEDKNIAQIFKQVFGNFCVMFDKSFIDYKPGQYVTTQFTDRENDRFLRGKEYITETVLLSTCNSLISVRCNGGTVAMMLNENFEHTYFFNLGRYGVIGLD